MSQQKIEQLRTKLFFQIKQIQDETTSQLLQEAVTAYSSRNDNVEELNSE